ncbi:MAG TPA: hypothetical protein VI142_09445 [Gaiellaceae bacterium]
MDRKLPDYVAAYLLERAIARLPEEVLEVLVTLSPEQIEGLAKVGQAFDEAGEERHFVTFSVH